ncbi:MAG: glycogen-binding domain-containing protein [Treponema sp.]|jgi:hypothetical protein|nr:glycogen-binding domain-containing protein [Treponema sp.]
MKNITVVLLLMTIIGTIGAVDTESYQFIDHLLSLAGPGMPEIYEDGVIFTAPSSYRRVGIAFAHEGFAKVYWFRKVLVPPDAPTGSDSSKKKGPILYRDSGLLFHVYTVPEGIQELEYRMVIDGLWTTDPANPRYRVDASGMAHSMLSVPVLKKAPSTFDAPPGSLSFTYNGPPGETITVAGSFNGWDPFMYPLQELTPGAYSLTLPLPPGVYQYVFFYQGRRILDPHNHNRVYTKDRTSVSEAIVR